METRHQISQIHTLHRSDSGIAALIYYSLMLFLFRFSDSIMSYFAPVYIENHVHSPLWMGIIISTSSVAGIFSDFFLGEWFAQKGYHFFILWGGITALLFPLIFLLFPPFAPIFILGMIIWGIYYELIMFSNYRFVHDFLPHDQHALGWGIVYAFMAAAYLSAPLITSLLIDIHPQLPLTTAFSFTVIGLLALGLFTKKYHSTTPRSIEHVVSRPPRQEFALWQTLTRVVWPILIVYFAITVVDAAFWTSGAIIAENLKQQHFPGGLIFVSYLSPALFMGLFAQKFSLRLGKKRVAYLAGVLGGFLLFITGFLQQIFLLLGFIFLASLCISLALPEINGTIEDYVERLGNAGNSMIGLQNSMSSLAYIIGPVLAGFIATITSHQFTFTVSGILLSLTSVIAFIFTPRKIKLPQLEIARLNHRTASDPSS